MKSPEATISPHSALAFAAADAFAVVDALAAPAALVADVAAEPVFKDELTIVDDPEAECVLEGTADVLAEGLEDVLNEPVFEPADVLFAEKPELDPVDAAVALDGCLLTAWPRVGKDTSPLTSQRPLVYDGQAGADSEGLYALMDIPLGVRVAHWVLKFV